MSFTSLQFLIFFMVVTLTYYLLKDQKMRITLLLLASCYFYMVFVPKYILILGGTILIDYLAGLQIAQYGQIQEILAGTEHHRQCWRTRFL